MPRHLALVLLLALAVAAVAWPLIALSTEPGRSVSAASSISAPSTSRASGIAGAAGTERRAGFTEAAGATGRLASSDGDLAASGGPAAPIQLTASDGTGLTLVALAANAVVEPPLAFTEIHLTFENPRPEHIEGRFRIALPPGAALSRFAMKGERGEWQEGEVVELRRARVAYEDFLHRRQDPALLELAAGNEFSARVFPIPAQGRKELIVSYSHALTRAGEPYVIPLLGLPSIGSLDLRVLLPAAPAAGTAPASNLGGETLDRQVVDLHRRDWTPDRDFAVGGERLAGRDGRDGLRLDNLAVVRVAAPVPAVRQTVGGLFVLIDSSASRALGYRQQVQRLAELLDDLRQAEGGAAHLGIAAFDQEVVPLYDGTLGDFGEDAVRRLLDRRPLGATDLHRALAWLAGHLAHEGQGGGGVRGVRRVLLIGDGVATAGPTEPRALKAAVRALAAAGIERLDVLAAGGLRDEAALHELTTGNLPQDGARIGGDAPRAEVLRRLTLACRSGIRVQVAGAAWIWPETLDGMQPGDAALVYADLPAERPLRVSLDGRAVHLAGVAAPAAGPLLARAAAQARIERLLHLREAALGSDDDLRRALALEVVELSVRHRVLSPFTGMLVLESAADYARFGLDRRAMADILTVGAGGLETLARGRSDRPERLDTVAEAKPSGAPAAPEDAEARRPAAADQIVVSAESALSPPPPAAVPQDLILPEPATALEAEGGVPASASPAEAPDGVPGGVPGGVAGGVSGGVSGGVPGGVPGGTARGVPGGATDGVAGTTAGRVAGEVSGGVESGVAGRVAGGSGGGVPRPAPPAPAWESPRQTAGKEAHAEPYSGRFAEVMAALAAGRVAAARGLAESWSAEAPGDVLALIALGEAWEAAGERAAAARAYGSLIDLFPARADLRRLAGERLERLGTAGLELAIDTYEKAVEQRPDHPSGHRLLAWARLRAGNYGGAFAALEKGIEEPYPPGRFPGVDRVLREDLGLLAAAWLRAEPDRREAVLDRLRAHGAHLATDSSLRFVLSWETDANDVDLHVYDRENGHADFRQRSLPSGGELFDDVTTGYGPECFAVAGRQAGAAAPYRLRVHYYSRGPMGYGMGTVQVVSHDGHGRLDVEPRPFVVMADDAMVDLGSVAGARAATAGKH